QRHLHGGVQPPAQRRQRPVRGAAGGRRGRCVEDPADVVRVAVRRGASRRAACQHRQPRGTRTEGEPVTYWGPAWEELERTDPEIARAIMDELHRLRTNIQLIASENLTSPAVLAAMGSPVTAK